ncbi:MAG TPA: SPOR domain-containing protein [Steroidobacteraceae bacterium]|nr:SPOR domain-containing protein [Steroidobacteraceae bacterium]
MPRLTTRDYKRTSRTSGAGRLKEFGLGVLVGGVLASAAFLIVGARARHDAASAAHGHAVDDSSGSAPHAPAPDDSSSNPADAADDTASPPQSASAHTAKQPQQYDFYKMLPSFKVPVPHDDEHTSRPPPLPAKASETSQPARSAGVRSYLLQVGSYRSRAEADQVRARLAHVGITAQIQHVVDGTRTWNRVRIGPLSDAELVRVRDQLRTANLHALVIRADR